MGCAPVSVKKIGFGLLIPAVIFFFNPLVAVLDFLPDFIGYLLLWAALRRAADLSSQLDEAKRGFVRMAVIDALKFGSNLWMIFMVAPHELPNTRLLLTFVFAVLEFIYAIPAWCAFFNGIYALIISDGDPAGYGSASKRKRAIRTLPEQMKTATIAFFICRNVFALLPELSSLAYAAFDNSGYVTNFDRNLYDFYGLFLFFALIIMLVVGIVWLVRMLRFAIRLYADRPFAARLLERYVAEVLPCEKLFTRRTLRFALALLGIGGFLTLDFYFDDINILPDVIPALTVIFVLLRLRRCLAGWQLPLALAGLWGAASVGTAVLGWNFFQTYYIELILRKPAAYAAYQLFTGSTVLTQAAFFITVIALCAYLYRLCRHYLANERENDAREFLREQKKQFIFLGVLALLSALGGIGYVTLRLQIEFMWLVEFAATLIFAIYAWKVMGELSENLCLIIGEDHTEAPREKTWSFLE